MQDPITLDRLIDARDRCAKIIVEYGDKYLPIFERLENEIENRRNQKNLLNRALEIGTRNGTQNGTHLTDVFMKTVRKIE